jgi:hypothetical protein
MQILVVNDLKFSIPTMEAAVRNSDTGKALELLVANGGFTFSTRLDYHAGARYPRLERDTSHPDMLTEILAPRR